MNYWVIVGEGGGFEEIKSVKTDSSEAQTGGIRKTTVRMDDVSFTMGGDGETTVFLCGDRAGSPRWAPAASTISTQKGSFAASFLPRSFWSRRVSLRLSRCS